jgi:hypothetical protein
VQSKARDFQSRERELAAELSDAQDNLVNTFQWFVANLGDVQRLRNEYESRRRQAAAKGYEPLEHVPSLSQRAQKQRVAGHSELHALLRKVGDLTRNLSV